MADRTRTLHPALHAEAEEEQALDTAPPPPYTDAVDSDFDVDSDSDSEDSLLPQKITINATRSIKGVGNIVSPISPSILSDAAKFSAVLLEAVARLNDVATATATDGLAGQRRKLRVDLTINCGVEVWGHRNAVGFGIKAGAKLPASTPKADASNAGADADEVVLGAEGVVVGGAKRKVDDEDSDTDAEQPEAKRIAMDESGDHEKTKTSLR